MSANPPPNPRILCLHGGGTNAAVFRSQCRAILGQLSSRFRFVFVEGPFLSAPHPAIVSVYGDYGPFRRWLRWQPDHEPVDGATAAAEIMHSLCSAMEEDDGEIARQLGGAGVAGAGASGANGVAAEETNGAAGAVHGGPWVGVLGFSQGAKVAASILLAQQRARAAGVEHPLGHGVDLKFGVLMAGRAPLVDLSGGQLSNVRGVADAGQASYEFNDWPEAAADAHTVSIPTLHVHGLRDPGHEQHVRLLEEYCKPGTARALEWDGDHRVVIKTTDVDRVVKAILEISGAPGVEE